MVSQLMFCTITTAIASFAAIATIAVASAIIIFCSWR